MRDENAVDLVSMAQHCDGVIAGEVMGELLMDADWSTDDMFYYLAEHYIAGSFDIRKGIDVACSILTGYHMDTIAQKILDREAEYDPEDDPDDDDFDDNDTW